MGPQVDTTNSLNRLEKVNNKDYVADVKYSLQYTRWFFTFLGIWPYIISKPTRFERFVSKIIMPSCCMTMIILPVPAVSYIVLRDVDRLEFIVLIGPVGFLGTNIAKYLIVMFRRDKIKLCLDHMESDWQRLENENDRDIMVKNRSVGHGLTIFCAITMQSGNVLYHGITPLCSGNVINELNETLRPLAYPGTDIYFDSQASVIYEIVCGFILIAAIFHCTVVNATFNLAAILVTHTCGQIEILMFKLSELVHTRPEENGISDVEDRLSSIIQWHVRVMRFSTWIDEVLREICLIEVVGSTLSICLLEYYCMMEFNNGAGLAIMTYILLLISLVFNICIYCHVGELLKEKCYQIGEAAYMNEWYKLPGKTGLNLILIIAISNYPRKITAGRMVELSINTFGNIMRSTFVYLNMIRSMT